ncbi:hypothetical protein VTO73DRAFT_5729 [Trametes versicolor]
MGRNPAFYLTASHETAVAFAKERSNAHGAGTQAAVVTATVHRDKVKVYEFDAVDACSWVTMAPSHVQRINHGMSLSGLTALSRVRYLHRRRRDNRVPVAYADHAGLYYFDRQYVIVTQKWLNSLGDITVEAV